MDDLKHEIRKTLDAAECTFYDQNALDNAVDELAAAVRSFMGSDEVVERAAEAEARLAALKATAHVEGWPCFRYSANPVTLPFGSLLTRIKIWLFEHGRG